MRKDAKIKKVARFMERAIDNPHITVADKKRMEDGVRAARLYYMDKLTLAETAAQIQCGVDQVQFLIEIGWRIIQTEQHQGDIESQRQAEISKIDMLREQHYRAAMRTDKKTIDENGNSVTIYDEASAKAAAIAMKATEIRMKLTGMDERKSVDDDESDMQQTIRKMDLKSLMALTETLVKTKKGD